MVEKSGRNGSPAEPVAAEEASQARVLTITRNGWMEERMFTARERSEHE